MERSEQLDQLFAALAAAQSAIRPAIKDATNPQFRSKYADLPAIWDACRAPLNSNGLTVIQFPVDAGDADRVALTTVLGHKSGQWMSATVSTKIVKNDPQGIGSALTYLRRYGLAAVVGVVADDDDDGNAASAPPQVKKPAAAPSTPQRPTQSPMTPERAKELFVSRFGEWSEHFDTEEPTTAEVWIAAGKKLKEQEAA